MSKRRIKRWLRLALLLGVLLAAGGFVLGRIVASSSGRRMLTAQLGRAFGRGVKVRSFALSWFPTPGIVASDVSISEDPRFGNDYFLRAESLTAGLRWRALLGGHIELGTITLSQPILNVVQNPDGQWNVASWMGDPAGAAARGTIGPQSPRAAAKFTRIEIDEGRVNFNLGLDRRPFALVGLEGSVDKDSSGEWRLSLAAQPSRAIVHLQETGVLHLTGVIGGTSAHLHPADVTVTWTDASLADALRLALGNDPGLRGELAAQMSLHGAANSDGAASRWDVSMSARVDGLHRWDMAARSDTPPVNFRAEGMWEAGTSRVDLRSILAEAPHSSVSGEGSLDWSHGIEPDVRLVTSGVAFADILDWYRAFQPGVADGLVAEGFFSAEAELKGWPPRIGPSDVRSKGVAFSWNGAPMAQSAAAHASFDPRGEFQLDPLTWKFDFPQQGELAAADEQRAVKESGNSITISARVTASDAVPAKKSTKSRWQCELTVSGNLARVDMAMSVATTFGRRVNAGWQAEGGLSGDLHWDWVLHERFPKPSGVLTSHDLSLKFPLLNQPVELRNAKIELKDGDPRVTLTGAEALGAHWQGTITRRPAAEKLPAAESADTPPWEFDLAADHLDATELDRWLGPRARPSWLARLFSASGSSAVQPSAATGPLTQIRAEGKLAVGQFDLSSMVARNLKARVELRGRTVDISDLSATVDGGTVTGGLLAKLTADPTYQLHAAFTGLNAAEIAQISAPLRGRLAGLLSGDVKFSLHGIGRENLLNSMMGAGQVTASHGAIRDLDVAAPDASVSPAAMNGQFSSMSADFSVASRVIKLERISLQNGGETLEGSGTADFERALRIELRPRAQATSVKSAGTNPGGRLLHVTGFLESPHVSSAQTSTVLFRPAPPNGGH